VVEADLIDEFGFVVVAAGSVVEFSVEVGMAVPLITLHEPAR
jgi:hypothetical protein